MATLLKMPHYPAERAAAFFTFQELHMQTGARIYGAVTLFLSAFVFSHQAAAALRQSLDMQVLWRPLPVKVAEGQLLVYELHLTNFASEDLRLTRISVVDATSASTLAALQEGDLKKLIGRSDRTSSQADTRVIPPGVHSVVYLSIHFQAYGLTPRELTHKVEYVGSSTHEAGIVEGGRFTASEQSLEPLGPPLRGGGWRSTIRHGSVGTAAFYMQSTAGCRCPDGLRSIGSK